jgi:hypothetical protein
MLDVLSWRNYVKSVIAFEEQRLLAVQMILTAFQNRMESQLELHAQEIDEALVRNKLANGETVPFGFELVNMDYEGGIVYKDVEGDSKRVSALKALLKGQGDAKQDFLLLLTLNVRNNDKGEIDRVAEKILKDNGVRNPTSITSQPVSIKYKVYIPFLIQRLAESNRFDCLVHRPIFYSGVDNASTLVHFGFSLRFNKSVSAITPSTQTMKQVLSLEMIEVRDGRIRNETIRFPNA